MKFSVFIYSSKVFFNKNQINQHNGITKFKSAKRAQTQLAAAWGERQRLLASHAYNALAFSLYKAACARIFFFSEASILSQSRYIIPIRGLLRSLSSCRA